MQIDWLKQKEKIFNEIYLKIFSENGFKKHGWEFYKIIEQNKLCVMVKINSSGNNSDKSVAFWVLIGLKFNKNNHERLKPGDIKLDRCEIQFSIVELLYPKEDETVKKGEYWYWLGGTESEDNQLNKKTGSIDKWESQYYGYDEGREEHIRERISEKYIKYVNREFNENNELIEEDEYIALDTYGRYNRRNIEEIFIKITEDTEKINEFINKLSVINTFIEEDTSDIISNKIKKKIIGKYNSVK